MPTALPWCLPPPEQRRSNDSDFPFRQDSYLHYLTGFPEPEAVLVLNGREQSSTLYCRNKDPLREIWDGFRYGPKRPKKPLSWMQRVASTNGKMRFRQP